MHYDIGYVSNLFRACLVHKGFPVLGEWEVFLEELSAKVTLEGRGDPGENGRGRDFTHGREKTCSKLQMEESEECILETADTFMWLECARIEGRTKGAEKMNVRMARWQETRQKARYEGPGDSGCIFQGNVGPPEYLEEKLRFEFLKDHTGYRAEKQQQCVPN